jgi:pSer/pThr/pTyr-binding forkhead associated (FHA) protein
MDMKLVVVGGKQTGMEIPIRKSKFLIGRGTECHLRPQSHMVSRKHCAILVEAGAVSIEDYGSTNGTFVNGEKVNKLKELHGGDRIKVGILELELRMATAAPDVKKPVAQSVPAAAAHAPAPASASDDGMDEISKWLVEDATERSDAPSHKKAGEHGAVSLNDTITGKVTDDTTTTMPTEQSPLKKDEKKKTAPVVGRFKQPAKPKADSSHSAAENMLRQFFPGKKA